MKLTIKQTKFFDAVFDNDYKIHKESPYREFYFVGGFGSGKSRIIYACINLICLQYRNAHGVFIRNTYPELADSVIPQYLTSCPRENYKYSYNKSERTATYLNGTRLDFRAFDKDTKILSNEYDFMAFSQVEEIPEELFLQSLGRNRRMVGELPTNIILGEGNPASGWVKRRLKDEPKENVFLIESRTKDNPYLPAGYEQYLRDNYPDFWVARYVDGEWSNLDEMVFSEFKEKDIIIDLRGREEIDSYRKRAGLDYGWVNPSGIVWSFVDYDGKITIFDEWKATQQTVAQIKEASLRYGKIPIVADYSIKKPDRDGRSLWQDLLVEGLNLIVSNKQELENIVLVNSLMKQGRLHITRNCTELITEMRNYKWKKLKLGEEKNRPEQPVDKDNHLIDAMLYMIADIEEIKTVRPEIAEFKKSIAYAAYQKNTQIDIQKLS